jgi:hypothetical protein
MNVIFGSGIVGLLAKFILGDSWTIIPFYRSRFFSFNPALDDNFIIADDEIDPIIKELTNDLKPQRFNYGRSWSIQGHLLKTWNKDLYNDWAHKIFGNEKPHHAEAYYKDRMNLQVYNIRLNELYNILVNRYMEELSSEAKKGQVTEIGDNHFIRNGSRHDFDKAISTIPLDILYSLKHKKHRLRSKNVHYLHIQTKDLNFEGSNQVFVVDQYFSFYKVTNVAPERYLIYCHEDIPDPGAYLMSIIPKFDILDGTTIENAIPLGPMPDLSDMNMAGITCVGSYAQWDFCADVGSNILRLMRYANKGNRNKVEWKIE